MTNLTLAVIGYKVTDESDLLVLILQEVRGIVEKCILGSGLQSLSQVIRDEIVADCNTFVLLKAIESFDESKGTEFSTHFYWQVRHYVSHAQTKLYRQKRRGRLYAYSLDDYRYTNNTEKNRASLADTIPSSGTAIKLRERTLTELYNIFNI